MTSAMDISACHFHKTTSSLVDLVILAFHAQSKLQDALMRHGLDLAKVALRCRRSIVLFAYPFVA
jgi:hypothetical protein